MNKAFLDYYRCPEIYGEFRLQGKPSSPAGYFRFGSGAIGYGQLSSGACAGTVSAQLYDAIQAVEISKSTPCLPFDLTSIVDNLRLERYINGNASGKWNRYTKATLKNGYYAIRPNLPIFVRRLIQQIALKGWDRKSFPEWPVDHSVDQFFRRLLALSMHAKGVDRIPFIWFWPEGYSGCAIMTHDVETSSGLNFIVSMMDIEDLHDVKSSFQIIPEERYQAPQSLLNQIRARGCEVNVHDLNHDGHLFRERSEFVRRVKKINNYRREFGALGFRSAVLYRNLDWYDDLEFAYDMSVPNVGHLDSQPGGCCTVMPYFIGGILELPLTTIQDYSLFHILGDYSIELWKKQIALILAENGLLSFNIHPDYVIPRKAQGVYIRLLEYLSELRSKTSLWMALPMQVDRWWRERAEMKLVTQGDRWVIEGPGRERARIAYAVLEGDEMRYSFPEKTAEVPAVDTTGALGGCGTGVRSERARSTISKAG